MAILPPGLPGSHRRCLLPNPVSGRGALLYTVPLRNVGEGFWKKICLFSPQFPGLSRAGKGPVAGPRVQARLGGTAVLRTRLSSRLRCCFCAAPSSCVPRFPLLYPHFPSEVLQAACCKESCKSQGTSNGCVSHLENPWSLCLGTPGRPKGRCCCSDPCSAGRGAAVCPAPGAARWGSQPGGEDVPWSVPRGAMDPGLCTCLGW